MSGRIITADEARELLHGATEGPWEVGVASSWQGSVRVESEMYVRRPGDNVALAAQVIDPRTEEISESNARLLAAAPDLAATVVAQAAEIERLRGDLARANAALRYYGPHCIVCDAPATRRYFSSPACDDDNHLRAVRSPAADRLGAVATETEHAAALRATEPR